MIVLNNFLSIAIYDALKMYSMMYHDLRFGENDNSWHFNLWSIRGEFSRYIHAIRISIDRAVFCQSELINC